MWLEATLVYSGAIANQVHGVMARRNIFTIDSGNSVRRWDVKVSAQRWFHNIRYVLLFPTLEICRWWIENKIYVPETSLWRILSVIRYVNLQTQDRVSLMPGEHGSSLLEEIYLIALKIIIAPYIFFSFLMEIKQKRIYPNFHVCRAQTYNSITSSEYAYNNSYMKEILEWFPTEFDNLENV